MKLYTLQISAALLVAAIAAFCQLTVNGLGTYPIIQEKLEKTGIPTQKVSLASYPKWQNPSGIFMLQGQQPAPKRPFVILYMDFKSKEENELPLLNKLQRQYSNKVDFLCLTTNGVQQTKSFLEQGWSILPTGTIPELPEDVRADQLPLLQLYNSDAELIWQGKPNQLHDSLLLHLQKEG